MFYDYYMHVLRLLYACFTRIIVTRNSYPIRNAIRNANTTTTTTVVVAKEPRHDDRCVYKEVLNARMLNTCIVYEYYVHSLLYTLNLPLS